MGMVRSKTKRNRPGVQTGQSQWSGKASDRPVKRPKGK